MVLSGPDFTSGSELTRQSVRMKSVKQTSRTPFRYDYTHSLSLGYKLQPTQPLGRRGERRERFLMGVGSGVAGHVAGQGERTSVTKTTRVFNNRDVTGLSGRRMTRKDDHSVFFSFTLPDVLLHNTITQNPCTFLCKPVSRCIKSQPEKRTSAYTSQDFLFRREGSRTQGHIHFR